MDGFESVFDGYDDNEEKFDVMFDADSDGSLIDACCGFTEGGECETDFDELHQTDDDADPDDLDDELGEDNDTSNAPDNAEGSDGSDGDDAIDAALGECGEFDELHQTDHDADYSDLDDELGEGRDTDNAPDGAEGSYSDPAIDMAMGEMADDEFSANGFSGKSDADALYAAFNEPEEDSALTGEGRKVDMDERNIEDEFDKMAESAMHEALDSDATDYDDDGLTDGDSDAEELSNDVNAGVDESFDDFMNSLDSVSEEAAEDDIEDPEWDHGGDSDLIDQIMGDD